MLSKQTAISVYILKRYELRVNRPQTHTNAYTFSQTHRHTHTATFTSGVYMCQSTVELHPSPDRWKYREEEEEEKMGWKKATCTFWAPATSNQPLGNSSQMAPPLQRARITGHQWGDGWSFWLLSLQMVSRMFSAAYMACL